MSRPGRFCLSLSSRNCPGPLGRKILLCSRRFVWTFNISRSLECLGDLRFWCSALRFQVRWLWWKRLPRDSISVYNLESPWSLQPRLCRSDALILISKRGILTKIATRACQLVPGTNWKSSRATTFDRCSWRMPGLLSAPLNMYVYMPTWSILD